MPAFLHSSKPFWNALFCIANSSCFDFSFISSIVAKCFPFCGVFSFGKRKESAGTKSDEYGLLFYFWPQTHLCQRFIQSWNSLFGIANSSCFDFSFISAIVVKRFPFTGIFSFEKRKKLAGAKSGENGGWDLITVLFLPKNSRTSIEVWAGALSWCKIHD